MADKDTQLEHSHELARHLHRDAQRLIRFLSREVVHCVDQEQRQDSRRIVLAASYFRALAWGYSVDKWTDTVSFQAVAAGARSLLEITTDLIFLSSDTSNDTESRIRDWSNSAKLKSAEAMIDYYENRANKPLPNRHAEARNFIDNHRDGILQRRAELNWKRNIRGSETIIHPERWTNRSLLDDLRNADSQAGNLITRHLGFGLEEFYETEYRALCWHIHGSGVTDILGTKPSYFNYAITSGIFWTCCLLMLCTEIILDEFCRRGGSVPKNVCIEFEYLIATLTDRRLDLCGE